MNIFSKDFNDSYKGIKKYSNKIFLVEENVYMPKIALLSALNSLDYYTIESHGVSLTRVTDKALISIAIPKRFSDDFIQSIKKSFGAEYPEINKVTKSKIDKTSFIKRHQNHVFMLMNYKSGDVIADISTKLNLTDQLVSFCDLSENWIVIRIKGHRCREVLKQICTLDIAPHSFPVASVATVSQSRMAAIIIHETEGNYLLLSSPSYALTLLNTLFTTVKSIS